MTDDILEHEYVCETQELDMRKSAELMKASSAGF